MINFADTARFARDLASLLRLGYTTDEAVMKAGECQTQEIAAIAQEAVSGLQKGQTLSQALAGREPSFPLFYRLLCSAEAGEALPQGLTESAELLEDIADRRSQTFLTVLYPAVVFTLIVLGGVFLLLFCGGFFENLFESMGLSLPLPTRMFLLACHVVSNPLGLLLMISPVIGMWIVLLGKSPMSGWLYKLPIYGSWLNLNEAIIFLSVAGQLIDLGAPLVESCDLATTAVAPPVAGRLRAVSERLRTGDKLSQALAASRVIPELGVWAISQRENTENLRLKSVANLLRRELDCSTQTGSVVLEPFLFVFTVIGLSFFVAAVMLPIYQLIGSLG